MFDLPLSLLFLFSSSSTILLFSFLHSPYSLLHNFNILTLRKRGGRGGGGGEGGGWMAPPYEVFPSSFLKDKT